MVKINPLLIPETETKLIAMTFLDAIKKFYSDPKNVEKFQEWKKSRYSKTVLTSA